MTKIINIILLVGWLLLIFLFSSETGDTSKSTSSAVGDYSLNIINKVTGDKVNNLSKTSFVNNHLQFIRKSAHFIEYFVLGILCFCMFKQFGITDTKAFPFSLLLCFVYACSDEIHQLFVLGRTSRVFDVFIDSFGSFTGIMFFQLIMKIKTMLF